MVDKYIRYTGYVLGKFEDIFKDKVTVSGEENIPKDNPIMFTANHFTRLETLLLPYFCNKACNGKMARSLADKGLFKGKGGFTEYLERTGTLSTDNPNRDEIIVSDLLTGDNNWIIYPEGNMMKNKKVTYEKGRFYLHLKDKVRGLFTGSAVLAIESQLYRHDAKIDKKKYFVEDKKISAKPTAIVPINISYYPIRPGANKLQYWIGKFVKNVSPRMGEEMDIETNILAGANMHIHYCKPIYVDEFISKSKFLNKLPFVTTAKRNELIINYYRHKLTTAFMKSVYHHVAINLDHIFALTLYYYPKNEIHIKELISRIYLNIKDIQKLHNYEMHPSVKLNVFKVLAGKEYPPLKSAMEMARSEGILIGDEGVEFLQINREAFNNEYEFHNIRLRNVMKILINEMMLLDDVKEIIQHNTQKPNIEVRHEIFDILLRRDIDNYDKDYEKFKSGHSKPYDFGKPFFLSAPNSKIGIVLSHGYKASPEEVRPLAEYLNARGYNVYCTRMHGHGTSAENLQHTSWLKWYDSYMRGVVAIDQICEKTIFAGFSTGGLLSLYAAAKHPDICQGVVSINAALKLQDIRFRFVKTLNFWNEVSDKIRGRGIKDFIEDTPENPEINYSRNYIAGVNELGKLMKKVKECLAAVLLPTLILQSKGDPIVKPESGKIIYAAIHSKNKVLLEPNLEHHVIVRGKNVKKEVFQPIGEFIDNLTQG